MHSHQVEFLVLELESSVNHLFNNTTGIKGFVYEQNVENGAAKTIKNSPSPFYSLITTTGKRNIPEFFKFCLQH